MWSVHEKIIQAEEKEHKAAAIGRRLGRPAEGGGSGGDGATKRAVNGAKARQRPEGREAGKRARRRRSRLVQ